MARRRAIVAVPHSSTGGLPAGSDTFYLCLVCRTVIPSLPDRPTTCSCGNVSVDPDGGRAGAKDLASLVVLAIDSR